MPYREVVVDGNIHCKTLSSYLTRVSLIKVRTEIAGIDTETFFNYAKRFVGHSSDLTANNRSVLETDYACRSHMSLRTMNLF